MNITQSPFLSRVLASIPLILQEKMFAKIQTSSPVELHEEARTIKNVILYVDWVTLSLTRELVGPFFRILTDMHVVLVGFFLSQIIMLQKHHLD